MQIQNEPISEDVMGWLNHEHVPSKMFTHREFAFTLPGDIYLRYNSFMTMEDFRKQVLKLLPSRFEIGAVYSAMPKDKKTLRPGVLQPILRELVFDIDMTDYDSIRTCCSGKGICKRCWGFIAVAVVVLDSALRNQFGFRNLLWVYSGRRGIHLWISDPEALALTDDQRKSLMGWLEVVKGGKEQMKKVNVRFGKGGVSPLHPALNAAFQHLKSSFYELVLQDQDSFSEEDNWKVLLEYLTDADMKRNLREDWAADLNRTSEEKWDDLRKAMTAAKHKEKKGHATKSEAQKDPNEINVPVTDRYTAAMEDIILEFMYPRLDSEVTKHRNHLLKAPFCVHPNTGRVCVPVEPEHVFDFDPEKVPTVQQLIKELDQLGSETHHSGELGEDVPKIICQYHGPPGYESDE
ncbi:hypothetical protein Clacol_009160 [Clathrus columnatus]|uniref:DNA primase n=1 Tax=Clathrus columnatus TaxID=1419009 RepID=A0AAV5APS6_9AGAM|nr:hypothetical protein Clacol_009160 [Clathrus columnatus]